MEEDAYLGFIKSFTSNYGQDHITFQCSSLKETIKNLNSSDSHKLLAFYFHNENDKFSNVVCSGFVEGEMRKILEESYNVLSWDVTKNTNGSLDKALDEWLELKIAKLFLKTKKPVLFIIYLFEETVTLLNILHEYTHTLNDMCTDLKTAVNNFQDKLDNVKPSKTIKEANPKVNDLGSTEFQQMIFDRLGDRDYDCFEPDEHTYLKDKIAFARFGPPQTESGYNDDQKKIAEETYVVIVEQNNKYAEWINRIVVSFIYNCIEPLPEEKLLRKVTFSDYNPYTDIMPMPIFVIRKCEGSEKPCRIFVDCHNRVYLSWEDYIRNNKLHTCIMILPKDGRYYRDERGNVQLERHASPTCGIEHTFFQLTDMVSCVARMASGAVFIGAAFPAIAVAPIVLSVAHKTLVGVFLYAFLRSSMKIYCRVAHGETMSISNSEARGAYLNIVVGSLGFVATGATSVISQPAADGVYIGQGARTALNLLNVANTSVTLSTLSVIQLASSVLFFGNSVYNFRTTDVLINDAQTNALKNHQESLRSNRHRKTFNKLMKETIRQNNGDTQAGRAEVISTISRMSNKDEIFAVLKRNNRQFNKEGVKFAANNGRITLNGVAVDLMQMGTMSKLQRTDFLIDLPPTPKPNGENLPYSLAKTTNIFDNVFDSKYWLDFTKIGQQNFQFFLNTATVMMFSFSDEIMEKIFKLLKKLFDELKVRRVNCLSMCKKYVSDENPLVICLEYLIEFLKIKLNKYDEKFQDSDHYLTLKNLDDGKRAKFWFEKIVNDFVGNQVIDGVLLNELLEFVMSKIALIMHNYCYKEDILQRRRLNSTQSKNKIVCHICGGYYFANY